MCFLTRLFNVCAFLVHRCAQSGRADVQHADLIHTRIKHPQRVLLLLIIVTEDLTIDEGRKHLCLQKTRQERQVGFWLVRQEGGLRADTQTNLKGWNSMLYVTENKTLYYTISIYNTSPYQSSASGLGW